MITWETFQHNVTGISGVGRIDGARVSLVFQYPGERGSCGGLGLRLSVITEEKAE